MSYEPWLVYCLECGTELRDPDRTAYEEITGFVKFRTQGGSNVVHVKRPTGRFMCNACMTKILSGVNIDQLALSADA